VPDVQHIQTVHNIDPNELADSRPDCANFEPDQFTNADPDQFTNADPD